MTGRSFTIYAGGGDGVVRTDCRFCGARLTTDQAVTSGICGSEACHARMIEESGLEILARKRRNHEAKLAEVTARLGTLLDEARAEAGEDAHVAMVPWQDEPLEPLPPERLTKFREHLSLVTGMAFREDVPTGDLAAREAEEPEEGEEVLAACSTCQGMCCNRGGDTALLLPGDIGRYRQRHPGSDPDEVIAAYLSHLPEVSVRNACVYQTDRGCALPRPMRQDICNSYYCDALRWLRQAWRDQETARVVLIAADDGMPRQVAALDPENGYRVVARPEGREP